MPSEQPRDPWHPKIVTIEQFWVLRGNDSYPDLKWEYETPRLREICERLHQLYKEIGELDEELRQLRIKQDEIDGVTF